MIKKCGICGEEREIVGRALWSKNDPFPILEWCWECDESQYPEEEPKALQESKDANCEIREGGAAMFYLRKEPEERTTPEIQKTDGTIIPATKFMSDDRAIYKAKEFSRFYRGRFSGLDGRYQGMKVYTCKTLKQILEVRESTFRATRELFDVYDENGKVENKGEWTI